VDKHTNTCVRTYTYLATHKYICPYIHTNIYVRTYAQIYTSVRTPEYICPYIHIPICTHLCIRLLHVPVCLNFLHISRCLVGALANKYKWIPISSTNEYQSQVQMNTNLKYKWIQISMNTNFKKFGRRTRRESLCVYPNTSVSVCIYKQI